MDPTPDPADTPERPPSPPVAVAAPVAPAARERWRLRTFVVGWVLALLAGTLVLKVRDYYRWLAVTDPVLTSEPVHVALHLAIYGTLTAACVRLFGRRWWWTIALVAAAAYAQEYVQTRFNQRPMGTAELFDFAVDAVAMVAGVLVDRALASRRARASAAAARASQR